MITKHVVFLTCMIATIFFLSTTASAQHPYSEYPVADLSQYYFPAEGINPEWSKDDLVFTRPKPAWEELSRNEKYIIAGLSPECAEDGVSILPWGTEVAIAAMKLYEHHGHIPAILTPDELRLLEEFQNVDEQELDVFRNPITGNWPLLKSSSQSPGNLYIRALTFDEMMYFAKLDSYYNMLWFHNMDFGTDGELVCAQLKSHVFYIRIYGLNEPIVENLNYMTATPE